MLSERRSSAQFFSGGSELHAVADGTVVRIYDASRELSRCIHVATVRVPKDLEALLGPQATTAVCATCGYGAGGDVWLCLQCHEVHCGRELNQHSVAHYTATGHCIAISLADLSLWCYGCDSYLQPDHFAKPNLIFSRLHKLKHSELPPHVLLSTNGGGGATAGDDVLSLSGSIFDSSASALRVVDDDYQEQDGDFPSGCPHVGATAERLNLAHGLPGRCHVCMANNVPPMDGLREDWLCLTCFGVYCGRFHHKHALAHFSLVNHPICMGLGDLSIWCYECMSYVDHNQAPRLASMYEELRFLKEQAQGQHVPGQQGPGQGGGSERGVPKHGPPPPLWTAHSSGA
jgi:hypothetical protein